MAKAMRAEAARIKPPLRSGGEVQQQPSTPVLDVGGPFLQEKKIPQVEIIVFRDPPSGDAVRIS
ncbi:hypothetical protein [Streptomyces sp. NPDC096033]|uniref:hypothetical protein n=1 Tax=Streptomyces sp. NPDC096033 TaxID=3366071 RepID=UPI0038154B71